MLFAEVAAASDVTGVLTALGSVFTFLMGQLSTLVDLVISEPLLLIPIGVSVAFVIVGFFRRIFRVA